jgi:aminoglycoside phosphotransferase (APT) family kinase protein
MRGSEPGAGRLVLIERRPNVYTSSAPSEIVTCRFTSGKELQLLLKYDRPDKSADDGHWRTVEHEIRVYQELLPLLPTSVARYYGTFTVETTGQRCLILQWLDKALRLHRAVDSEAAMALAAQWLGKFHAAAEARLREALIPFLNTYEAGHYIRWARHVSHDAGMLHERYPWLWTLCEHFEEASRELVRGPLTVIHGEYYPMNILVGDDAVYPVDWQSAAIARGELDLASMIEGWQDDEVISECIRMYQQSRWPDGAPEDFHRALAIARVYWPLRWLGAYPQAVVSPHQQWRLDDLAIHGQRAGLL